MLVDFDEYQRLAQLSDQRPNSDAESMVIPALGLVAEAGSVANVFKKWLRDGISFEQNRDFLTTELGDVLWYVASIASRLNVSLNDVAALNLARTRSRYGYGDDRWTDPFATAVFDAGFPDPERFPRKLLLQFSQTPESDGQARSSMRLVAAEPNPFPDGKDLSTGPKGQGFTLGDTLRDNSRTDDGYRYHDAIHVAFMAVLGWSPVMRSLLRLKRKSDPTVDDTEDAARAVDVEEGISTQLVQRAAHYQHFMDPRHVDNDTLDLVLEHVKALEVRERPGWLWKHAISQGFVCMSQLHENHGGYILADLDERTATFSRFKPQTGIWSTSSNNPS